MSSILSPLESLLNWITCLVTDMVYYVAVGIMMFVNYVIAGIAVIILGLLSVLPSMPSLPSLPTPFITAEGWVSWFWPVGTTVDIFAFVFSSWLIWLGVSIAFRWAKALNT